MMGWTPAGGLRDYLIAWSFEYARTRLDAVDRARRRRSDGYLVKDDLGVHR